MRTDTHLPCHAIYYNLTVIAPNCLPIAVLFALCIKHAHSCLILSLYVKLNTHCELN